MLNHSSDRPFRYRTLGRTIAAASLVLSVWLAGCAETGTTTTGSPDAAASAAQSASEAQAQQTPLLSDSDRLTALVVRAWPIGAMLQASLDKDPNWPVGKKASKIGPARLKCLRQQLSPEGYRASRKEAVDKFIQRHPDQVQDAIDVLEQGGADIMSAAFQSGLKGKHTGGDILKNVAPNFTSAQFGKFIDLVQSDKYKSLRQLLFSDSGFPFDKSAASALQLMRDAMNHCRVPMRDLQ